MDSHAGISKHRLRAGGGHGESRCGIVSERVSNVIELALAVSMLDFNIRQSSQATGAPVDQSLSAIEKPIFVESNEDLANGLREPLVHGESEPAPVTRGPEPLELLNNRSTGLGFPLPDASDELFPAERFP